MRRTDDRRWAWREGAVLLVGDSESAPEMERIARLLSPTAHATVLIETFAPRQVYALDVPEGVRVTWLVRAEDGGRQGARSRGSRLALAVHAWCAEWSCPDEDGAPACTVWLGPRTAPHVVRMTRALIGADRTIPHDHRPDRAPTAERHP